DVVADLGDAQHLRADDHAEHDLDHHGGKHDPDVDPRQERTEARGGEDEDERASFLAGDGRQGGDEDAAHAGAMPQEPVKGSPGSRSTSASRVWKAFGGHVIGSTARLRRATSGRGSPVESMRKPYDSSTHTVS